MNDDILAAAESYADRTSGNHCPTHRAQLMDAFVAGAWRYAPPADDGEPVTEEWLRSVGFRDYLDADKWCSAYLSLYLDDAREHWGPFLAVHWARPDNPRGHYWSTNGRSLYKPAYPTTRGAVRRLLAALGAPGFA